MRCVLESSQQAKQHSEHSSQGDTHQGLLAHYLEKMEHIHPAGGQATDNNGTGLGGNITPHAGNNRDKGGQG